MSNNLIYYDILWNQGRISAKSFQTHRYCLKICIVPLNKDFVESMGSCLTYRKERNLESNEPLFLSKRNTRLTAGL